MMQFYLSSYSIGQEIDTFLEMTRGKKLGILCNASDHSDAIEREAKVKRQMEIFQNLEIEAEEIDLRDYFGKKNELEAKLNTLGGVWVKGGNTFVLRQAMKLSGFDVLIQAMKQKDFLYSGYSAGICILAPDLHALSIVDNPNIMPYPELQEIIWQGLGILDFIILPHYQSDHPESPDIEHEVAFCKENNIAFQTLRDGEVLIIR